MRNTLNETMYWTWGILAIALTLMWSVITAMNTCVFNIFTLVIVSVVYWMLHAVYLTRLYDASHNNRAINADALCEGARHGATTEKQ